MHDLDDAMDRLERRLKFARAALRREERRAWWDAALDRAASVIVLVAACLSFVAAAAPFPSRVKGPFKVVNGERTVFAVSAKPARFGLFTPSEAFGVVAKVDDKTPEIRVGSTAMGIVEGKRPTISVGDDTERVAVTADDDTPTMNLTANGVTIVEVGLGPFKGGHLLLTDTSGNTMLDAGMTPNGQGAVQTYPNGGSSPGRTFFGLPGTFICGVGGCD